MQAVPSPGRAARQIPGAVEHRDAPAVSQQGLPAFAADKPMAPEPIGEDADIDALPRFRGKQVEKIPADSASPNDVLLKADALPRAVALLQYRIPDRLVVLEQLPLRFGRWPVRLVVLHSRSSGHRH